VHELVISHHAPTTSAPHVHVVAQRRSIIMLYYYLCTYNIKTSCYDHIWNLLPPVNTSIPHACVRRCGL